VPSFRAADSLHGGHEITPTAAEDSFREAASVPPTLIHRAALIHPQKSKTRMRINHRSPPKDWLDADGSKVEGCKSYQVGC